MNFIKYIKSVCYRILYLVAHNPFYRCYQREAQTVADYRNATIMMLADVLNDKRISLLKKFFAVYNNMATDSANGQMDLFTGKVKTREEIIKDVFNLLNYGTSEEIKAAQQTAVERRKEAVPEYGDGGTGGERGEEKVKLSNEKDDYSNNFVLTSKGTTEFGFIRNETGLPEAEIKLSLGDSNYGLIHLEKKHGKQIRSAGFENVLTFVEYVCGNYQHVRVGETPEGNPNGTYLIQIEDTHNNTLYIELSKDGSYWKVNSGGVFRKGYGKSKEEIWSASERQNQLPVTNGTLRKEDKSDHPTNPNGNEPHIPKGKDSEADDNKQGTDAKKIGKAVEAVEDGSEQKPVNGQARKRSRGFRSPQDGIEKQVFNDVDINGSEAQKMATETVMNALEKVGIPVKMVSAEDAASMMDEEGIELMGSRVKNRQEHIASELDNVEMDDVQRGLVEAFVDGARNNSEQDIIDKDGNRHVLVLNQGAELKTGIKHSLFEHYGTNEHFYNAKEILLIPEIISEGVKDENGKRKSYTLKKNGVKYTLVTETKKGKEVFINFYTDRKKGTDAPQLRPERNTELTARTDKSSNSTAKVEGNSESPKNLEKLTDSKGVVYGWTDGETIYLNEEAINPNTPIHEYTHLWGKVLQKRDPKTWNRIKGMLKGGAPKPKMGMNINQYKEAKAKRQQKIDEAQEVVDFWNEVKNEQEAIAATEQAEQDMQAADTQGDVAEEVGDFGPIYRQFKGKAREAISHLMKKQDGEAIEALYHPEIGYIDLVWGKGGTAKSDGYGLSKLVRFHPEVLDNLQEILEGMHIVMHSANRIQLESDKYQASVRLTWNDKKKNWLLTAFEKKNSASDNTTDTDETPKGKQNDTATPLNTVPLDKNSKAADKHQETDAKKSGKAVKATEEKGEIEVSEQAGLHPQGSGKRESAPASDGKDSELSQPLSEEEAERFISEMENRASTAPEVELTIENWDALFGESGLVETPIGEVKMGGNQFAKLMRNGRNTKLGMIKPTLEEPDVIIENSNKEKVPMQPERASSYIYVKSFKKDDGSRFYYFTSVTVSKDGKEVVVSNQEKRRNKILNLLKTENIVWRTPKDTTVSSAEKQGLDYAHSNIAENATKGSVMTPQTLSSKGKDSEADDNKQGTDAKKSGKAVKATEEKGEIEASNEFDENGNQFIKSSNGSTDFGENSETRLSEE